MVTMRDVQKLLSPLHRRLRLIANRAIVSLVTDALQRQNLQLRLLADETADDVERFQNYGHSSVPPVGSEAIVLSLGGARGGVVAIAVEDKGARPKGLESGDSVLYHLEGHNLRLTKNGTAILTVKKLIVQAESETHIISPSNTIDGPLHVTGPITSDTDVGAAGISLKGHDHEEGVGAPV